MIPKVVHYCWFGRGPKNELAIKCIESWKKFLPDYEFKEWNEDNFDLDMYQYAREAYDNRKFAFVTDVVRLYALYHEGGVYMDTDVEVLKTYDPFLHHTAFSGFETNSTFPTGTMAAEKGSQWTKDLLDQYNDRKFVMEDGSFDMTTNTTAIMNYMLTKGMAAKNSYQDFPSLITAYPAEYFCPKDHTTGKIKITDKTVCIHHFAGSWLNHTWYGDLRHSMKHLLVRIMGEKSGAFLSDIVSGRIFHGKRTYK